MPIKNRTTNKPNPFKIVPKTKVVRLNPLDIDEIIIKIIIATKSWIIKNPIEIFPYNAPISSLSDKSFMMIIVLLNVKAIATYIEIIVEKPINLHMKNPINEVNITWPIPVTEETLPTSFITLGLKLKPTIKRSSAIPICENILIVPVD